jgi:hypothetical protein
MGSSPSRTSIREKRRNAKCASYTVLAESRAWYARKILPHNFVSPELAPSLPSPDKDATTGDILDKVYIFVVRRRPESVGRLPRGGALTSHTPSGREKA